MLRGAVHGAEGGVWAVLHGDVTNYEAADPWYIKWADMCPYSHIKCLQMGKKILQMFENI